MRVRFTCGQLTDVVYADPHGASGEALVHQVIGVLAEDGGSLSCRHGDRLIVLFSRGVASIELAPRGAVL